MIIQLVTLREGVPQKVREQCDPKALDLEFVDLVYVVPVTIDGLLEKGPDTLSFKGELKSRVRHTCGRCLKEVDEKVDLPFDLYYEIKGKTEIDTTDDLREVLILDHPISFLCSEDCRGLCPRCGQNRNEAVCQCEGQNDHPFAKLKDGRFKKED